MENIQVEGCDEILDPLKQHTNLLRKYMKYIFFFVYMYEA
jgi:hypothetical protein